MSHRRIARSDLASVAGGISSIGGHNYPFRWRTPSSDALATLIFVARDWPGICYRAGTRIGYRAGYRIRCGTSGQPQCKVELPRRSIVTEFIDIPDDVGKRGRLMDLKWEQSFRYCADYCLAAENPALFLP